MSAVRSSPLHSAHEALKPMWITLNHMPIPLQFVPHEDVATSSCGTNCRGMGIWFNVIHMGFSASCALCKGLDRTALMRTPPISGVPLRGHRTVFLPP